MLDLLNNDWKPILQKIMLDYPKLENTLQQERSDFEDILEIYPPDCDIFRAFQLCSYQDLKIIIIGQDPYHQPNQAQGLAFSVNKGIKIPPSLQNIFKEIKNDLGESEYTFKSGDLTSWASQGVLLLNTTLTVRQGKPNSHLKLWHGFTQKIVDYVLANRKDVILMLWGNNAKNLIKKTPASIIQKHHIFTSTHPSPLSANRGGWFGKKMFSSANQKLLELGKEEIKWLV